MTQQVIKGFLPLALAVALSQAIPAHAQTSCPGRPVNWRTTAKAEGRLSTLRVTGRRPLSATSRQRILGGEGCISFTAPEARHDRMVGLANNGAPAKTKDFAAAFHLLKKGRFLLISGGRLLRGAHSYKRGDRFTIRMENDRVSFAQNDRVIFQGNLSAPASLAFGARMKKAGATLAQALISDSSCLHWTRNGKCTKRSTRPTPFPTPGNGTATPVPTTSPAPTTVPTAAPTGTPTAAPTGTSTPAPTPSRAATRYVSTTGSDSGAGSATSPWRSVQYAVNAAPANTSIVIRGGTYTGAVVINKSQLTLQSYPGELARITTSATTGSGNTMVINPGVQDVVLSNLDISGGFYYALKLESSFDNQSSPSGVGPSKIVIDSCNIHDSGSHAVKLSPESNYVTIRNTEVHHSGVRGAANGIDAVNANWLTVQNCYIHDIQSGDAFFAKGGSAYTIIERTLVEHASNGILLGQDTGSTFFNLQRNPNRYENMYGVARNNIVIDTRYTGIGSYSGVGVKLLNNTVIGGANVGQAGIYFAQNAFNVRGKDAEARGNIIQVGSTLRAVRITANALSNNPVLSNNLYFSAAGQVRFDDLRSGFDGALSQWASHLGGEAGSLEANPMLDAAGNPQAASPVIDRSITMSSFSDDFKGNQRPRGAAWDIGAVER